MDENTCICCGRIIPEGRHICLLCEGQNEMQTFGGRPKTNADRIRHMTDEELAKFLNSIVSHCRQESCNDECPMADCCACDWDWQERWLKQEAKQ